MIRPLWAVAGVAVLGTAGAVGALIASPGGDEEVVQQVATMTASATSAASPTPSVTASTAATPTPAPSMWQIYADPEARFTVRFDPKWYVADGAKSAVRPAGYLTTLFSTFPLNGQTADTPANGLKIDLIVHPSGPGTDCQTAPAGSTTAKLGGVTGWQTTRSHLEVGSGRSRFIAVYRDGYCYTVTGYFGNANSDDVLFDEFANSFSFTSAASR